jgi:mRNA-degrading endonuclease RelE of RelBE toxin-antitoxin system
MNLATIWPDLAFEIIFSPEAAEDFRRLATARLRAEVRDAIETHLRHEPRKVSKSRIKRLRGVRKPEYRLRVGEVRVFYDVIVNEVHVLAIVPKSKAAEWLRKWGTPE